MTIIKQKATLHKAATKVNPTRTLGAWWTPSATPGMAGPPVPIPVERYDGRELRPFEGRRGAMDAFKLPSGGRPT